MFIDPHEWACATINFVLTNLVGKQGPTRRVGKFVLLNTRVEVHNANQLSLFDARVEMSHKRLRHPPINKLDHPGAKTIIYQSEPVHTDDLIVCVAITSAAIFTT